MDKYIVIEDNSEQLPWSFTDCDWCAGQKRQSMDTGDYTLEGFEDKILIERKGTVAEFYHNIVSKDYKRFRRELDRMNSFPNKHVILCFHLQDIIKFPWSADIPYKVKKAIVARGSKSDFFLKRFIELQLDYPEIHFNFCGDDAQRFVSSLFKRIIERYA